MSEVPDFTHTDPRIKRCTGTCGRLTRHAKMPKANYPGVVTRVTEGRCVKCNYAWKRAQQSPEDVADLEAKKTAEKARGYEEAQRIHDIFLAERRARIARREQLQARRLSA